MSENSVCPDLILVDIPEEQEAELEIGHYLQLDSDKCESDIIFLVSRFETREKIAHCQFKTVDSVLKPINQQALIDNIEAHFKLQQLQESLTRQEKESKILFQLSENIRQSLNLEVTLQQITTEIQKFLNCDRVIINSYTENYPAFTSQAVGLAIAPIIPETYSNFLSEICGKNTNEYQQYQQGKIQIIEDINHHYLQSSAQAYLNQLEIASQLIIPICIQDVGPEQTISLASDLESNSSCSLWGWLIIHQCNLPKTWPQPEIRFLQHLVSQVAIAIRQNLFIEQLQQIDIYDPLTKVYNRRYLDQQLSLEWRRLQRIPSPVSAIICDIDYFQAYKNHYGEQGANQCLQNVAQLMCQAIRRPADFISLYSEDKLAIILPHTPVQGAQNIVAAIQVMLSQLQLPHAQSPASPFVTLSFGIATTIPNATKSPNSITEAAEQALYIAKSRGRNCSAIYNKDISQLTLQQQQELTWSKRLHDALEKNLFCLYAQCIEPLDTEDQRQHFEILLRLQEQDNVIIPPNDFLPIANRCAMMPQIDSWVIENLFSQLSAAEARNYQEYVFTINLSGASLNDDIFLDFLQTKIMEYNLDPQLFCFEITESVALDNIAKISDFIKQLKNLGCSFALDDFGTGMSSLTYLKELPVDYVKIDGSFIREINNDAIAKSMVTTINNLAQIIGLKTIAEFVENQAILETIQDLKIDYAQGFHFAKPCLLNNVIS
ncbi:MAG: EAL domain-containing protein [Cyanobacteria bacterium P01_F01_bin.143]